MSLSAPSTFLSIPDSSPSSSPSSSDPDGKFPVNANNFVFSSDLHYYVSVIFILVLTMAFINTVVHDLQRLKNYISGKANNISDDIPDLEIRVPLEEWSAQSTHNYELTDQKDTGNGTNINTIMTNINEMDDYKNQIDDKEEKKMFVNVEMKLLGWVREVGFRSYGGKYMKVEVTGGSSVQSKYGAILPL